jgi:hypothetical protein
MKENVHYCAWFNESGLLGRAIGYTLEGGGGGGAVDSWQGQDFFFPIPSMLVLGVTQSCTQWAPGALLLGVKWPGCETDHSPLSYTKDKHGGALPQLPHIFRTATHSFTAFEVLVMTIEYSLLGLWHCVVWIKPDISVERVALIFWAEE